MSDKYQGQLWGGPEHGNLIGGNVERVCFRREDWFYNDGLDRNPTVIKTVGEYVWNDTEKRFDWKGPGADGDTIERLRLG